MQTNFWLNNVGYQPRDANARTTVSVPPATRLHTATGMRKRGSRLSAWLFQASANCLPAALFSVGLFVISRLFSPAPPQFFPQPASTSLDAVQLERLATLDGVLGYDTLENASSATALTRDWYLNGRRTVIGAVSGRAQQYYYAATRRPGFEAQWAELVHRGLQGLHLFEVHVPVIWRPDLLDLHVSHWSVKCGTQRESIRRWSSFKESRFSRRVDQCRPGGICLIVAHDCGDAFADLVTPLHS